MLAMELAPDELKDEMADMAREMGLMPEAEEAMHKMLAEREALGLSNAGIVTDAARIHRKQ
jgi:hypothetical protein